MPSGATGQEDVGEMFQMVYDEDGVPVAEMVIRKDSEGKLVREVRELVVE
jgi:hypothetical protein